MFAAFAGDPNEKLLLLGDGVMAMQDRGDHDGFEPGHASASDDSVEIQLMLYAAGAVATVENSIRSAS